MNARFEGSYMGDASKLADEASLECGICWWVYDPALGDEVAQIAAGTPFARLPDAWRCPNCDAEKHKFMVIGSALGELRETAALERLVNAYRRAALSMKGLPIYNPTLVVEGVGFRDFQGRQAGVIVTPWFMNLTVLPGVADQGVWRKGESTRLVFPSGAYDFVVSEIEDPGLIGTCSLFSPMLDFADHAAARVAAQSAADSLFEAEDPPPAPSVSRRQLLTG
jgi:[NiFe] hydrogenase assembly HybE family chaperone